MTTTAITAPGTQRRPANDPGARRPGAHLGTRRTDEPSGTWTGLACPDHGLAIGSDVDNATLRRLAADSKLADLVWEAPENLAADHNQAFQTAMQAYHAGHHETAEQHWREVQATWSRAWAANYTALELLQNAGITTFSPVKPQRWVIASFEHHCGPHGFPRPHIHNVVLTGLKRVLAGVRP